MSKKYENRIKHLKEQEQERKDHIYIEDHENEKKNPNIDADSYKKPALNEKKISLKGPNKKVRHNEKVW